MSVVIYSMVNACISLVYFEKKKRREGGNSINSRDSYNRLFHFWNFCTQKSPPNNVFDANQKHHPRGIQRAERLTDRVSDSTKR